MIPIELFDYSNYREIDIQVTKYVNKNLETIIRVLLDILNNDCDFDLEGFFPRDFLERKPEECRRLVDELYELIESDILRDYIKPKYEYLLYAIISWWDDIIDEEDDLLPIKLKDEQINKIKNEEAYISENGENYILKQITCFESYYYICFQDHDFLPRQLSMMVSIFLRNNDLFNIHFPSTVLRDYVDLMPCDLRELYFDRAKELSYSNTSTANSEIEQIVLEILYVLQDIETRVVENEKKGEVEISNDIYSSLNRALKWGFGLDCTREMTIGRANKKLGETDLYLYKNDKEKKQHYAIIENKNISGFETQYKQLLGYLNYNFKFGVTISINKKMNFQDALSKVNTIIESIKATYDKFKITRIDKPYREFPYVIRSYHIIPEDTKKEMPIYHLILNLNDTERKMIAKQARKK